MSIEPYYMQRMQACETQLRKELAREQITHPLADYAPGSPHLERLYVQMADAQRWTWPAQLEVIG